jgi:hypothetical protein
MVRGGGTFDARAALRLLGGERIHHNYSPGASDAMMASVKLYRPVSNEDFADVHAIATAEIGCGLASLDEIKRVDRLTDAAIWVVRRHGAITGFLAPLALTLAGRTALAEDTFDAAHIRPEWVARMGQPLAGFYCWSYAGRDQVSCAT